LDERIHRGFVPRVAERSGGGVTDKSTGVLLEGLDERTHRRRAPRLPQRAGARLSNVEVRVRKDDVA